jgi:hypothetical protein
MTKLVLPECPEHLWPWLISVAAMSALIWLHRKMMHDAPNHEATRLSKQYEQIELKDEHVRSKKQGD